MADMPVAAPGSIIIAKASRDYRWRRYALVLLILGYGIYSLYDGFIHYPAQHAEELKADPLREKFTYPDLDIKLNNALGLALPPLAAVLLAWALHASRGEYRFDGSVISTPGHPGVPLESIRKIDRSQWDRKGIAYLHYHMPSQAALGCITLDDFIYDRTPTDEIFKRVEATLVSLKTASSPNVVAL